MLSVFFCVHHLRLDALRSSSILHWDQVLCNLHSTSNASHQFLTTTEHTAILRAPLEQHFCPTFSARSVTIDLGILSALSLGVTHSKLSVDLHVNTIDMISISGVGTKDIA
ncbi:hypothetical protein RCL_jg28351.t1 [Rhizophagus clarus]|uniref:Uncharacterized protein n=1 Tax=Rhizophagus clarus TaxID=94130 RepID=A0A8H3LQL5_9GLOM|nr:hypothetical protein RCL_jg28351.t1 [Rhizophagus clarus]